MQRNVDISEISDGRKYTINDMAKIGCNDCKGCSACCENMQGLITLDPYDIYRMTVGSDKAENESNAGGRSADTEARIKNTEENESDACGRSAVAESRIKNTEENESNACARSADTEAVGKKMTFENLMQQNVELTMDRGVIIPTLKMSETTGKCTFLDKTGRCSIHSQRPGICRLFPMGRLYENDSFYYFLQKDECSYQVKTKVKLKQWLGTPDINKYEKYICDWHYFIKKIQDNQEVFGEANAKQLNMMVLQMFYINPYENEDFYSQFYGRLGKIKPIVDMM